MLAFVFWNMRISWQRWVQTLWMALLLTKMVTRVPLAESAHPMSARRKCISSDLTFSNWSVRWHVGFTLWKRWHPQQTNSAHAVISVIVLPITTMGVMFSGIMAASTPVICQCLVDHQFQTIPTVHIMFPQVKMMNMMKATTCTILTHHPILLMRMLV